MSDENILIIEAADDISPDEIEHVQKIGAILGLDSNHIRVDGDNALEKHLAAISDITYIYLCTHADQYGFGNADGSNVIAWSQLAFRLCEADCLIGGSVLLLSCCRGGAWPIAVQLFHHCADIEGICGPRWKLSALDLATAFHVFLYNIVLRREQPWRACERAQLAVGYDFFYYDRLEMEDEIARYKGPDDLIGDSSSSSSCSTPNGS